MSYTVEFKPSGRRITVEAGQPILAAGIEQGVGLPYSCKTGICRTCKARVETGSVDLGEVSDRYLSTAERAQGQALLCRATAQSDCTIEVREAPNAIVAKMLPARLGPIEKPTADVTVLRLRLPMNQKLLFHPGQYIDLLLAEGKRRSYSIANVGEAGGTTEIELHIKRTPGGFFTDGGLAQLKERDIVRFNGPFGSAYLREDEPRPIIMVCTGTGFAPIKAMVEALLRKDPEAGAHVYWGARSKADLYMLEQLEAWQASYPGIRCTAVLSQPTPACEWSGRTGYVHQAVVEDHPDLSTHQVYACGSPAMVDAAREHFTADRRLPPEQFHADAFLTEADRAGG
jgi:CDP-4-dehydro-6-deoxyglucose reductase